MPATTVLDVHAHVMPLQVLKRLEEQGRADLSAMSANRVMIDEEISGVAAGNVIPLAPEQYDAHRRREARVSAGVTAEAVSIPPFLFASQSTNPDVVMDLARLCNDTLREYVANAGDGVMPLYSIPVGHPDAAVEARRCMEELDGAGVTIGTFGLGLELDAPQNEDLWSYLAENHVFTSLHPSRAPGAERLRDYHLLQLFGYPVETALAASRLVFSGVLDRHELNVCLAHGGGCLLGVAPRLDLGWRRKQVARTTKIPPREYLERFYYDTAVFDHGALQQLVTEVGVDRVLLGTDFPFDLADTDPVPAVMALELGDEKTGQILFRNAERILRVPGHRGALPGRGALPDPSV